VNKAPIVFSVVATLACGQSYADPLASDATACDAAKVDARNVVYGCYAITRPMHALIRTIRII
jgi:hypothetical protein